MKISCKFNTLPWLMLACLTPWGVFSDPTKPEQSVTVQHGLADAQVAALPKLSLIRSAGSKHQALIDGRFVSQGDTIGLYRVKNISAKQVVLQQNDQLLVLHLLKTTAKSQR